MKKILLGLLVFVTSVASAQTITSITIRQVSHSGALLSFAWTGSPQYVRVRSTWSGGDCGTGTGTNTFVQQFGYNGGWSANPMQVPVEGLPFGSMGYTSCVELSNNNSTWTTANVSGGKVTWTSAPTPAVHPALPNPPRDFTSFSEPAVSWVNVNTTCANFLSDFATARTNQDHQDTKLILPHGTICDANATNTGATPTYGVFNMEGGTSQGVVMVTVNTGTSVFTMTGANAAGWAIEGQKVQIGGANGANTLWKNADGCGGTNGFATGYIGNTYYLHLTGTTDQFTLYCDDSFSQGGTQVTGVNAVSGSLLAHPVPWVNLHWIEITTDGVLPPDGTRITPNYAAQLVKFRNDLTNNLVYGNVPPHGPVDYKQRALLFFPDFDTNVHTPIGRVIMRGVEFTNPTNPQVSPDPIYWFPFLSIQSYTDEIVCNQCYFFNTAEPSRMKEVMNSWNGAEVGIVNSYMDNISYWQVGILSGTGQAIQDSSTVFHITPFSVTTPYNGTFTNGSNYSVTISGGGTGYVYVGYDAANNKFGLSYPTSGLTASAGGSPTILTTNSAAGTCRNDDAGFVINGTPATYNEMVPIGCVHVSGGSIDNVIQGNSQCTQQPSVSGCGDSGVQGIIAGNGPGPYLWDNNFVQEMGLFLHFDDSGGVNNFNPPASWYQSHPRYDYTVKRSTFLSPQQWMIGTAGSNGEWYGSRQPLEWKGGSRIDVGGNIFFGSYAQDTPNNMTPTITCVSLVCNDTRIHDNVMFNVANGPSLPLSTENSFGMPGNSLRFEMDNNLVANINANNVCNSNYPNCGQFSAGQLGRGWATEGPGQVEDITMMNNSFLAPINGTQNQVFTPQDGRFEGFNIINNFFTVMNPNGFAITGGINGFPACSSGVGAISCLAFNGIFKNNTFNSLSVANATSYFNSTEQGNNYFVSPATDYNAPKWFDCVGTGCSSLSSDFHLRNDSAYNSGGASKGLNGLQVGVDMDRLYDTQGHVRFSSVTGLSSGSTTVSVNFRAPDSRGCPVWLYTSDPSTTIPGAASFTGADAGGSLTRNISVSGLSAHTQYWAVIQCAVEQPTVSFTTN